MKKSLFSIIMIVNFIVINACPSSENSQMTDNLKNKLKNITYKNPKDLPIKIEANYGGYLLCYKSSKDYLISKYLYKTNKLIFFEKVVERGQDNSIEQKVILDVLIIDSKYSIGDDSCYAKGYNGLDNCEIIAIFEVDIKNQNSHVCNPEKAWIANRDLKKFEPVNIVKNKKKEICCANPYYGG